ncbi:uncharacterized protein [Rutidosis leptorrhynchoides]|uniref:uncharacterized protein isoform X2 n=1 Tax=Rutidosis leptorrhynchoides TaxID=125765 RepID=UPI003A9A0066
MMPPYGTPIPYPALYPPARVYAHSGMAMQDERELQRQKRKQTAQKLRLRKQTPSAAQPVVEMEPKASHGKKRGRKIKYKVSLGNENVFPSRNGEGGKAASSSGNHGTSTQSVESEHDGSSNANHISATAGDLNMWIDLWNPAPSNVDLEMQPNSCDVSQQTIISPIMDTGNVDVEMQPNSCDVPQQMIPSGNIDVEMQPSCCDVSQQTIPSPIMGRDDMIPDQCTQQNEWELKRQKTKQSIRVAAQKLRLRKQQDERELRRQKRKQANREAAKKLRLRKQKDERELKRQIRKQSNREAVQKLIAQQDTWELKRQRRKQSNREAAHHSRLRKQAECDKLIVRVQVLSNENGNLKDELQRLAEQCKKLTSENNSMKDKLNKHCEPDAVLKLDGHIQLQADDEGED